MIRSAKYVRWSLMLTAIAVLVTACGGASPDTSSSSSSTGPAAGTASPKAASGWSVIPAVVPPAASPSGDPGDDDPSTQQPDGGLSDISCVSSGECIGIASLAASSDDDTYRSTLTEKWDGNQWTLLTTSPASNITLSNIACASITMCLAAGEDRGPTVTTGTESALIFQWDGQSWSPHAAPDFGPQSDGDIMDMECPDPSFCVAVGTNNVPVKQGIGDNDTGESPTPAAAIWNGSRWAVTSFSKFSDPTSTVGSSALVAVDCPATQECVAIGSATTGQEALPVQAYAEVWNGSTWTEKFATATSPFAFTDRVAGLSCTSSRDCVAAGEGTSANSGTGGDYVARWDGSAWTAVSLPASRIRGFDCLEPVHCIVVGDRTASGEDAMPFAAEVTGGSDVHTQVVPLPPGAGAGTLAGVACPNSQLCLAFGSAETPDADGDTSEIPLNEMYRA